MMFSFGMMNIFSTLLIVGRAMAGVCTTGVTNDTTIASRDEPSNPAFVHTSTGTVFFKYNTPIFDATEEELVAMEYTGRYELDNQGVWWVVTREGKPLSRTTKMYSENFGTIPFGTRTYDFEYTESDYIAALQKVRKNRELQSQAMEWVRGIKARSHGLNGNLEKRRSRCAVRYTCQDASGCQLFGDDNCNICESGLCWDSDLPDAC